MSLKYTHSKDYRNLLNNAIENELATNLPNNEVLWVAMGNELEIEGVKKTQISTIMRRDIEEQLYEKRFKEFMPREDYKWHNGTYWLVTKKNGWTNSDMARHVSNDNLDPSKGSKIVPCANPDMREVCYDLIHLCRILNEKSKDVVPLEEVFGKKHMKEFYKQVHTMINNCKNAIDNKTKVPKNTEIFLLECLSTIIKSVNKCAEIFMEQNLLRLKEQGKFFTLKQATKFQKGMRQSQQFILKPTSRDTALFLDYAGIQCECGSYRVRQTADSNKLECYDCDMILPQSHISKCKECQVPLYKERLIYMIKHKNKCPNCEAKNDLPLELVEFAKS